jgi:hypothetical protein
MGIQWMVRWWVVVHVSVVVVSLDQLAGGPEQQAQ